MSEKLCIAVLGSTGSIGEQTLGVVRQNPESFDVLALTAGRNIDKLIPQIKEFSPKCVLLGEEALLPTLKELLSREGIAIPPVILSGSMGYEEVISRPELHAVVVGISGFAAFDPVLSALHHGKHLALANKECMVAGAEVFTSAAAETHSLILPVDSEHNSIYQCMNRRGLKEPIRRITLTASGGPFFRRSLAELDDVTPELAVRHPRWNMGAKISVDSATLMNKALEVMEAAVLFDLTPEQIQVLIHPESIIHGMVEYCDGTTLAALYEPDMRVPICYALKSIREHVFRKKSGGIPVESFAMKSGGSLLDLSQKHTLTFFKPDPLRFPAVELAYKAIRFGKGAGAVLNAANEIAVSAFLDEEIRFIDILAVVIRTLDAYTSPQNQPRTIGTMEDVNFVDSWGRKYASQEVVALRSARERLSHKPDRSGFGSASEK